VLRAAKELFATYGFEATTTRMIADAARVDQALVVRMFGGKEALFRASVEWPFDPAEVVPQLVTGPRRQTGRRVAERVISTWEDPVARRPILALLRSATGHEDARRLLTDFVTTQVLIPVVVAFGADEPALRADLIASHLVGIGLGRYVLAFEPLASADRERIVETTGAIVQRLLTIDLG
jgi:AcrR family transcriptional regulator